MMRCKQVQKKLVEYSEHMLEKKTRHLIQRHVQTCSTCAQELYDIEETLTILKSVPLQEPSDSFWEDFTSDVMRKIHATEMSTPRRQLFQFPRFTFAAVLLGLIVVLIGIYLFFQMDARIQPIAEISDPGGVHDVNLTEPLRSENTPPLTAGTDLRQISSEELAQDMLDSGLALFEGTLTPLDMNYNDDTLDILLYGLTIEEKQALLFELRKMKDNVSP